MKHAHLLDDFLSFVKVNTRSNPNNDKTPSFEGEFNLAKKLKELLKELVDEVFYDDENCYVYGLLKKNTENKRCIGFNSHMDTSPEESGENVKPRVFKYEGGDIEIGNRTIIKEEDIVDFSKKLGKTFITASGDTLLGADDKAGIANIISMLRYFKEHPKESHGDIYVAFTPDEEIGQGIKYLDMEHFKIDFGFTVDGSGIGEYDDENFNAINGKIIFTGYNVHAGSAYKKMRNAVRASSYFMSLLDEKHSAEGTKNREGYIHFDAIEGDVNKVELELIIRDFTKPGLEKLNNMLEKHSSETKKKFKGIGIKLNLKDAYSNMKEIIDRFPEVSKVVEKSADNIGLVLKRTPIRGGTDGAMLSWREKIAMPNIFTGGYNFHSKKEYAVLEEMEKSVDLIIEIVKNG